MTTRRVSVMVPEEVKVTVMTRQPRQVTRQVKVTKTIWEPACPPGASGPAKSAPAGGPAAASPQG
jgi:hypothetical protein